LQFMTNPYNCSAPGNCFVGYLKLRNDIVSNLQNKHSYAIIGGRRCGKTSMLMQIEKDLEEAAQQNSTILPRLFSVNELSSVSPAILFETIFKLIVRDIDVRNFQFEQSEYKSGYEYQIFKENLNKVHGALKQKYGPDWKVILLIDELDAGVSKLPDDRFFQNLRNMDMESGFKRHFRLIVTGVKDMAHLILAGSPLNHLDNEFLRILTLNEMEQLVQKGFSTDYYSAYDLLPLYELTGGHPYLLQGILEIIWDKKDKEKDLLWSEQNLREAGKIFLKKHPDFKRWLNSLRSVERAVYRCLAQAQGVAKANIAYIRSKTDPALHPEIEDALQVLSYHGLIDDSYEECPKIAGILFRDWFIDNCPVQNVQNVCSDSCEPVGEKSNPPFPNIAINLTQINTQTQGFSANDIAKMLEIFESMKKNIESLPIDNSSKLDINHNLDKAMLELKEPSHAPDAQSRQSKIIGFLKNTGKIIKEAGGTAESFSSFINKVQELGTYLGEHIDFFI
jgi:hypothetical protein